MDEVKNATKVVDTIASGVKTVEVVATASNFSIITKILFIVLSIFSGVWFRALKKKFSKQAARDTEAEVNKQAEQEQRTQNQVENQQAASDSKKVDDLLK